MIKIEKLDKYFNKGKSNEVHVINETNLVLGDTGLVCILGESGSGKTTLMNTISGLDDFKSGTIDVDGEVIKKFGQVNQERIRNEKFGYIFQNYYLLMDQTVEYNIMLALSLYDISDEEKENRIDYVLNAVDMSRYKKRLVSQLSGGQQQRVAIARALAKTPKVIFADEPTGNLDESNTMRIMSILKKISKDCLVVVVTHEKSIADFFADRIINISDGRIVSDKAVAASASYEYTDDTNIYLGEFEKNEFVNNEVTLETYSNGDMPKVSFKFIYLNDKLYIYPESNVPVEIINDENEKKVIEGKKPVVELKDVDMDYALESITSSKIPKLKFKDMLKMALENIAILGKKQIFLIISFIIMAVLMVLTLEDILSVVTIDEKAIVSGDSHIFNVEAKKNGIITNNTFNAYCDEFIELAEKSDKFTIEPVISPNISYKYDAFWQINEITTPFSNYSIINMDNLSEEAIIYGRMAEAYNEVVIDRRVLENYLDAKTEIANIVNNIEHFLDKEIIVGQKKMYLKVVGICDSGENSMYMDKFTVLSMVNPSEPINSIEALNSVSENKYKDVDLKGNQALIPKTQYEEKAKNYLTKNYPRYYNAEKDLMWQIDRYINAAEDEGISWGNSWDEVYAYALEKYVKDLEEEVDYGITYEEFTVMFENPESVEFTLTAYGKEFEVVGSFDDEYDFDIVVSEDAYEDIKLETIKKSDKFQVYSNDKKADKEYIRKTILEELPQEFEENVNIVLTDTFEDSINAHKEKIKEKFDTRIIVTVAIFLVSMVILYFMMKSNAVSKITDLGVYRLLGISKNSIMGLFAIENLIITTYTSLIAVILTVVVTKFLGSIPSLGMTVVFPWYAFVGTLLFIYVANVIIGVMPVMRLLKLPPAKLASKYDI